MFLSGVLSLYLLAFAEKKCRPLFYGTPNVSINGFCAWWNVMATCNELVLKCPSSKYVMAIISLFPLSSLVKPLCDY